jgi:predicted nucleotidyltransferase
MELKKFIKDPYRYVSKRPRSPFRYLLIVHAWLFQGIMNTDYTERAYKIIFEVFTFTTLFFIFSSFMHGLIYIAILALLIAHTINWLVNGGVWCMFRGKYGISIGAVGLPDSDNYFQRLTNHSEKNKGILKILLYGSYARGKQGYSSDVDLRLIRKPGIFNAVRALKFCFIERTYALMNKIPLDLVLLDDETYLSRMDPEENPIVIFTTNT